MSVRLGVRWATVGGALVGLLVFSGCQRRVQLVPAESDSTAHEVDSSAVRIRRVQQLWEAAGGEAEAAHLTARVVADALGPIAPAAWKTRADALLDSLGVGGESAASECAMAINFFDRTDPGAGSWPYLFWCGGDRVRHQAVEGRGLRLVDLTARGIEPPADPRAKARGASRTPDLRGAAALYARRGGSGLQPLVMAWRGDGPDGWSLMQTLGPDSLGGVGTAEFDTFADTVVLVARTYRTPRGFDECATCPHVYTIRRFKWGALGFERIEERAVPSTYSSFVRFVQALMADDRREAESLVDDRGIVDHARRFEWHRPRGAWRVAPGTDESPDQIVFYRGDLEAYRIDFVFRYGQWLIAGIENIPRAVE